jgi:hypothetical protein
MRILVLKYKNMQKYKNMGKYGVSKYGVRSIKVALFRL